MGPTTVLAATWAVMPALAGFVLLAQIGPVGDWLRGHGQMGALAFLAVFVIASGLGLLPTYAQSILGGWVFGLAQGLGLALLGFLGGAVLGFVVSRAISGDAIERRIAAHPQASVVKKALVGRGFMRTLLTVTLLRLPPNSPFALMNLALSGGGAKFQPYLLGTLLGMTPRTAIVVAFAAAGAAGGNRDIQEFMRNTPWWQTVGGVGMMILVLLILGIIGRLAIAKEAGIGNEESGSRN